MNEDFVSFSLAKKLKEKGYPQAEKNALAMYDEDGDWCSLSPTLDDYYYDFEGFDRHDFVCPTIAQVLKWLREEKKWNIEIYSVGFGEWEFHCTHIITLEDRGLLGKWNSYELTALAGIEYVIDNLI